MHVLLVGCGHLGQALLRRWLNENTDLHFTIIKPSPLPDDCAVSQRIVWHTALPDNLASPDVIIYAIRPQLMAETLPQYRVLAQRATNISVAAGWSTQKIALYIGDAAIIRTMPNVPAQIGQGMTPMVANATCDDGDRAIAEALFRAVGAFVWLDDEAQIDIATAVSGSGPAYVYLLAAVMTAVGTELGLPPDTAATLARATVRGAANYMVQSGETAETLYKAMLLPGGTTEAAMRRLLASDGLGTVMREAIIQAARRARQIGTA